MRRAAPPWVVVLLALAGLQGTVNALCGCAERFAASSDVNNTGISFGVFSSELEKGETRVFRSASFHCNTTLRSIKYSGRIDTSSDCSSNCVDNDYSQFQLWRLNETNYILLDSIELDKQADTLDLDWQVQEDDVIGLWIPPKRCQCLQVGYLYGKGGSRNYHISGMVSEFNTLSYKLEDGPLPMISVETDEKFNVVCIIGLPAGALIAIIGLGFTCAAICWSAAVYNKPKSNKTGKLVITHSNNEAQQGMELNILNSQPVTYINDEETPSAPSPSASIPRYDSMQRPIYTMPLPPIPLGEDEPIQPRSYTGSPRIEHTDDGSSRPYGNIPHSMSNPNLSTNQFSNDDSRNFHTLTREPKHPLPTPRTNNEQLNSNIVNASSNLSIPSSFNPVTRPEESGAKRESFDRSTEFELPDDETEDEGGMVQDEYMNVGSLPIHNVDSFESDDVYY